MIREYYISFMSVDYGSDNSESYSWHPKVPGKILDF